MDCHSVCEVKENTNECASDGCVDGSMRKLLLRIIKNEYEIMKHGPIALIDEEMPIVVIATRKDNYEKVVSNIQEVKARGGKLIAIVTEGDTEVKSIADHCIEIPKCFREITPLLSIIPLQLLSYHIALMRNCNVDQPRNLAKSVTVE